MQSKAMMDRLLDSHGGPTSPERGCMVCWFDVYICPHVQEGSQQVWISKAVRMYVYIYTRSIYIYRYVPVFMFTYILFGKQITGHHWLANRKSTLRPKRTFATVSGDGRYTTFPTQHILYCLLLFMHTLQVQRFSKTWSFVKDQVLLDLFVRLKFSHLPTSLALTTCYNHLSPGKLGPWRFTVLSR